MNVLYGLRLFSFVHHPTHKHMLKALEFVWIKKNFTNFVDHIEKYTSIYSIWEEKNCTPKIRSLLYSSNQMER